MTGPAIKMFGTKYGPLPELPTARDVRTVYGHVDITGYRVRYYNSSRKSAAMHTTADYRVRHYDSWGDARFPWQVLGPLDENDERNVVGIFPQYREAVAFAKKCVRIRKARGETGR